MLIFHLLFADLEVDMKERTLGRNFEGMHTKCQKKMQIKSRGDSVKINTNRVVLDGIINFYKCTV